MDLKHILALILVFSIALSAAHADSVSCSGRTESTTDCSYLIEEEDCTGSFYYYSGSYRPCGWDEMFGCSISGDTCQGSLIDEQSGLSFKLSDGTNCTNHLFTTEQDVYIWKDDVSKPVGIITEDFSQVTGDISWPAITVLSSSVSGKALFNPGVSSFGSDVSAKYILIPKTTGSPYLCDSSSLETLDDVTTSCEGYDSNPSYAEVSISSFDYYKIETTNSGGGNGGSGGSVPEFSDLGWILACVLGAGGFFIASRKLRKF